jgi:hypothetical protein
MAHTHLHLDTQVGGGTLSESRDLDDLDDLERKDHLIRQIVLLAAVETELHIDLK